MSGSAICFTENPKITAASRNMHITGKEKTLAATPVREVLAAGGAVSDGEYDVIGKQVSSPISVRSNCLDFQRRCCRSCRGVLEQHRNLVGVNRVPGRGVLDRKSVGHGK